MVINTQEELAELNEKSNIIHRFLAESQLALSKIEKLKSKEYGLDMEGRVYFEVFKIKQEKKAKAGGRRAHR